MVRARRTERINASSPRDHGTRLGAAPASRRTDTFLTARDRLGPSAREVGEEIEFDGTPGNSLAPLNALAFARHAAAAAARDRLGPSWGREYRSNVERLNGNLARKLTEAATAFQPAAVAEQIAGDPKMTEVPRYRTTRAPMTFIEGAPYYAGTEITTIAWPTDQLGLVPLNEPARRIAAYWKRHHLEPHFPAGPRHAKTAKFYLPAYLPSQRSRLAPPAVPRDEDIHPDMPRYQATFSDGFQTAHRAWPCGAEIVYLWWPEPGLGLEPANAAAETIARHYDRIIARGIVVVEAPWNLFDDTIWLPGAAPLRERAPAPNPQTMRTASLETNFVNFLLRDGKSADARPTPSPRAGN